MEEREGGRAVAEGDIGVPTVGGRGLGRVDLLEERLRLRRGQGRVSECQRAEPLGEGNLSVVVEALVAEEHDAMAEERPPYLCDRLDVQLLPGVHAADLGADAAGEAFERETCLCPHDCHGCASST